ncbi:hypothetical protein MIS46_06905 [Wielerella bovis]|uniref:hypothetical protein n=1 Tax=Wielerella bovis TaxID=2917790 RepID=UPI00201939E7|nr:hypothetical protein [Wielerella bovis]ULJ61734.1 hypothetical protein MIS46_06905 [Wielerella bovis]
MEDKATQRTLIDYFLTHLADKIHEPYLFGFALYLKSTHYHDEERINLLNAAIPLFIQAQGDEQHGLYAQAYLLYAYMVYTHKPICCMPITIHINMNKHCVWHKIYHQTHLHRINKHGVI